MYGSHAPFKSCFKELCSKVRKQPFCIRRKDSFLFSDIVDPIRKQPLHPYRYKSQSKLLVHIFLFVKTVYSPPSKSYDARFMFRRLQLVRLMTAKSNVNRHNPSLPTDMVRLMTISSFVNYKLHNKSLPFKLIDP